MSNRNVFLALAYLFSLFLFTTCSNILNVVISPFAPDFLPKANASNGIVSITLSLDPLRETTDTENGDWEKDYAWYIYRSDYSPYQGMELVGRFYLSSSLNVYKNTKWEIKTNTEGLQYFSPKYTDRDFSLSVLQNSGESVTNQSGTDTDSFIDKTAPRTTLYYPVSLVRLKLENTEVKDKELGSRTNTNHSLFHKETSGWAMVDNQ